MFSDSYPITLVDDLVYEVEGKNTTVSNDIDPSLLGANASAEGGDEDEGVDPNAVSGINLVIYFKYVQTGFEKPDYKKYIAGYMKKYVEMNFFCLR